MKRFKQVVSLGYFCSPALEFERIGRRAASLPLDWLLTPDIGTVIQLIQEGFPELVCDAHLAQLAQYPQYYRNTKWNVDFYHDFSPFRPLDEQITTVSQKYDRRIARFYETIQTPTLFCRYLTEQDFPYVQNNYPQILQALQQYCPDNQIVFVINEEHLTQATDLPIYPVKKDSGDSVARRFLESAPGLEAFLLEHVEPAPPNPNAPTSRLRTLMTKSAIRIRTRLGLVYRHHRQV